MSGPLLADRVKETSTTTGTGTLDLAGTSSGFRTFVAGIGTGNTCFYCISHRTADEWEVGIGTVTDAGTDTLSRTTVLASSNSGSLVNFSAGTKDVFNCDPASNRPSDCVLLDTKVASSSATIDFVLTGNNAGFAAYKVVLAHVAPATDNVELWLRTSSDGGSTYDASAGNYRHSTTVTAEGGGNTSLSSSSDTEMVVNNVLGNATDELSSGEVILFNPSAAKRCVVTWHMLGTDTAGFSRQACGGGIRLSAADVDAIRFLFSSGNIASGTFYLYGLRANSQVVNTTNATAATQSEMEAASSLTTYVSPGREKYHPGVAKAWVNFNGTGTVAINASHNVTSITDNGTGDYTVNFTTAFSSANYVVVGITKRDSSSADNAYLQVRNVGSNPASGAARFQCKTDANNAVDCEQVHTAAFGDQ